MRFRRVHVEIREEPITKLTEYADIPIAFTVECVLDVAARADGSFDLSERSISPYLKDYDAVESPAQLPHRFDLTKWGLLGAYRDSHRVGGAVIAFDTPGIDLLEGRSDLALLWDIRVRPDARRNGVGTRLFRAGEQWALARACTQIKIETQNVNVPACRFYARQGCVLRVVNRAAYTMFQDEIQLLWYKDLVKPP